MTKRLALATNKARSEAIRTLTEAAQSAPDDGEPRRYSITVRDEGKDVVYEAFETATCRWEKQLP
ncbi:DUF6894 family protein [Methylobacterium sp. J-078]|uniref:DUF6894 family protein n=1 Tax=Methylobacterium sp. J-078 TaxID=2836657 RepID=UPI00391B715B